MKYLKYFEETDAYEAYKNGSDFITPNVSYTVDTKKVYYNPHAAAVISYNMVDLGLPSGLKWADRNVGALSPEDAGLYFAWGETVGYTVEQVEAGEKTFDFSDYFDTTNNGLTFNKYNHEGGLTVLETADDAAAVNMGSNWRMPTNNEYEELINNTTATFIDLDGNEFTQDEVWNGSISEGNLKGVKFTGSNSNSIFIPAAGRYDQQYYDDIRSKNLECYVWSSNINDWDNENAKYLGVYGDFIAAGDFERLSSRGIGMSVRGVCN